MTKITHALISVTDKTGLIEFAKGLIAENITIISTGGTAKHLKQHLIPVEEVANYTGFPEILEGRVKTLHPKIHGGILARGEQDNDILGEHNIPPIALVAVNLYPFQKVTENESCSLEEAIENIDIGGPTLLRAAAKNYTYSTAIVNPEDYPTVLAEIKRHGETRQETRLMLAKKVFAYIADYDIHISNYFQSIEKTTILPEVLQLTFDKKQDLRYGENPHQQAAFYITKKQQEGTIGHAIQTSGKPLSYNNITDADVALECVKQFSSPACVIVKHGNPCAVSLDSDQLKAYQKAFHADSISAFGGIIAFNTELELPTLEAIFANQFVEVVIAPHASENTIEYAHQKPNVRLLTVGNLTANQKQCDYKSVSGGFLLQESDNLPSPVNTTVVTQRQPDDKELKDLLFAWQVVRFMKSNAIAFARQQSTLGLGPGQTSRIFSTKIAALKANEAEFSLQQAVMASDAFFPFRDSIDEAGKLGISAIIQPGGSIRDNEIIEAANEYNIAMIFTNQRHFRH